MDSAWPKIRRDFIKGMSYAKLAAKYGLSESGIGKRARAEGWKQLRDEKYTKSASETVTNLAHEDSRVDKSVHDAAVELLEKFRASVSAVDVPDSATLKDWGSALRSIQMVISSEPTELDIRKKEAEIAKLMRDAAGDQVDNDIEIVLPPEIMED